MSLEEYPRMNIDPYTVYCMPAYTIEPNTSMYVYACSQQIKNAFA